MRDSAKVLFYEIPRKWRVKGDRRDLMTYLDGMNLDDIYGCHKPPYEIKMIENGLVIGKLWPKSVVEYDFEGFKTVPVEPVVNKIVSLAKIKGLDLDNNDIGELVKEHGQELTTEEFTELHCVLQQDDVEERNAENMGN
ncbi:hypothetical protein AVEN_121593-1 [Araneus ventricosus]|uniref:Uncharacterized protein n=1 Tax=Araneus ventricosus TaxID=182803 RepID=A0A4Y2AHV1_ARAVE|nr:hypothetical protein AVEN_94874-1 [Araneus ventricosus]GBL79441.1 hypothetical protein AVEN_121593-1 [Araneus ventricosus]